MSATRSANFKQRFDLLRFDGPDSLARTAAQSWIDWATKDATRTVRPCCVALSGGRIARRFFQATVERAGEAAAALAACHFFWADERCVEPSSPDSNHAIAQQTLLKPLGVGGSRVHRVLGELDPSEAATRAIAEMQRIVRQDDEGQPVIDLVFLGMGEDGHVASLFPGETAEEMNDPAWYRPVVANKPPPRRITLGYAALSHAREVWVLASGPGKENALRVSLSETGDTPLARVIRSRPYTRIYSDM